MKTPTLPHKPARAHYSAFAIAGDSAPEKVIDDLAWLAAQICCTPFAVVSLAATGGHRVKAKVGLTVEETTRGFPFGEQTASHGRLLIVTDAIHDPRHSRDCWVTANPRLRFFAGAPLVGSDGKVLGVLSVMDRLPRQLSREQSYALEVLARQITNYLERRAGAHNGKE